ncbi:uncharacterized protein isoform X2 [Choristoneura fumiferana]|uniref:uncharacterized protein isoform X2 n=1 Tax=Choristoneura fumiferana TaxID=7141 RepID=UPI003D15A133
MDAIIDFVRVRQINLALAGLLVLGYLFYQFGGKIMKLQNSLEDEDCMMSRSRSRTNLRTRTRSRSRSRSRSTGRGKYLRRRAAEPRCSSCGMDHFLED